MEDTAFRCVVADLQQLSFKPAPPGMSPTCMSISSVPAESTSRQHEAERLVSPV